MAIKLGFAWVVLLVVVVLSFIGCFSFVKNLPPIPVPENHSGGKYLVLFGLSLAGLIASVSVFLLSIFGVERRGSVLVAPEGSLLQKITKLFEFKTANVCPLFWVTFAFAAILIFVIGLIAGVVLFLIENPIGLVYGLFGIGALVLMIFALEQWKKKNPEGFRRFIFISGVAGFLFALFGLPFLLDMSVSEAFPMYLVLAGIVAGVCVYYQIARLVGYLCDRYKIGGFLSSVFKGLYNRTCEQIVLEKDEEETKKPDEGGGTIPASA